MSTGNGTDTHSGGPALGIGAGVGAAYLIEMLDDKLRSPEEIEDLLGGRRMYALVSVGLEVFDLIVFDAPPVLGLADAPLIASAAETAIFVDTAGQSNKGQVRNAVRRLQLARAHIVGSVMTKFVARNASYGSGYGCGYGYGYGHEDDPYKYGGAIEDGRAA